MEGGCRDELMNVILAPQLTVPTGRGDSHDNFHCSHCGKHYLHMKTLRRHMLYDCGTKPRFSCSVCGLRARRRYTLTKHLVAVHCVPRDVAECSVLLR
jgi:hypothetical protein